MSNSKSKNSELKSNISKAVTEARQGVLGLAASLLFLPIVGFAESEVYEGPNLATSNVVGFWKEISCNIRPYLIEPAHSQMAVVVKPSANNTLVMNVAIAHFADSKCEKLLSITSSVYETEVIAAKKAVLDETQSFQLIGTRFEPAPFLKNSIVGSGPSGAARFEYELRKAFANINPQKIAFELKYNGQSTSPETAGVDQLQVSSVSLVALVSNKTPTQNSIEFPEPPIKHSVHLYRISAPPSTEESSGIEVNWNQQ